MTTGQSRPLCSVEACTHNNSDCQAIFDEHFGCDFVYCYNEKIYAASTVGNCIRIKCASANESVHETIAYDVLEGDISLSDYYVYEDKLYIGASVENPDVAPLTEDDGSYMSYQHPSIYRFDFATGELDLVYRDEKGDYGVELEILYAHKDVLYFDSGEPDGKRMALDVVNETVSEVEGYDLLGENTYSGVAFAYEKIEDVRLADSKERNRRMVVLHPWE